MLVLVLSLMIFVEDSSKCKLSSRRAEIKSEKMRPTFKDSKTQFTSLCTTLTITKSWSLQPRIVSSSMLSTRRWKTWKSTQTSRRSMRTRRSTWTTLWLPWRSVLRKKDKFTRKSIWTSWKTTLSWLPRSADLGVKLGSLMRSLKRQKTTSRRRRVGLSLCMDHSEMTWL